MPHQPFRDELAKNRRTTLFLFYVAALFSVVSVSFAARIPSLRAFLFVLAIAGSGMAILFLLLFLRTNDEHERQINYRALTFAFIGTLAFCVAIGFLQRVGFHTVAWLDIPPLMIILWGIGLILYSWRYR